MGQVRTLIGAVFLPWVCAVTDAVSSPCATTALHASRAVVSGAMLLHGPPCRPTADAFDPGQHDAPVLANSLAATSEHFEWIAAAGKAAESCGILRYDRAGCGTFDGPLPVVDAPASGAHHAKDRRGRPRAAPDAQRNRRSSPSRRSDSGSHGSSGGRSRLAHDKQHLRHPYRCIDHGFRACPGKRQHSTWTGVSFWWSIAFSVITQAPDHRLMDGCVPPHPRHRPCG